ncbi:T7SS effector LXG polymorphic toxin [Bacillus spizizenii]|uniref:ribonuclease YeeF family protein n=1 Tax=Bacillus spizizenii TaxID=96241 RepID=UPI002281D20C|nr:T7SS effector LXG polymorphic toxin [Bacillus spizizenii]MCY7762836.1 T7SS effector LXG polymorphic toxin [Bacillus spizizenii]MCY7923582.1 T7SS effector LXG polymorphic toxin [Bacillus spizizenii]MCY8061989.1 T7SS effector LXG polymorphic toxin [Bacillus spizizenii]MCY8133590.1 T7SS effector LXG polymorphic toxin [Bacillus spizizenii]MCY8257029.1 T7SS effector LXG polymorphic toxin [Bacillus spizizenii]
MKTLDVHALHEGIQHTIEKLEKQKQQLEKLEKSVEHLAGMKDALKGKGGDAIRTFYEECHKPFLLFFGMFIDEYKKVLKQTQHAITSVESDSHGMIAEAFLSHDARHGVKHAREVTEQLTDAVNRQTSAIDHIVSLPTVNDSLFRMETEQADRLITDTLHKLFQFDGQQTQALETAKSDFQTMKKYIDQLETMYTGPKIEITGYKSGSILKSLEEENINKTFGGINSQMKQADDSPMELMLKKLEKHRQSNVDTVMKDSKQQKIEREIHADDGNVTVLQKEAAAHPKVYGDIRVINDKLYNHKGLKKIDTIEVIDELTRDTASIDYVGGKYFVYENGQIVREFYAGGKKRLEEVSYIPEDKVGGAKPLDSFLAGTQYEFIEWVSPQGAVKKLAVRGGKRVVTNVAKHVAEKESKGEVKKVVSKKAGKYSTSIDHRVKEVEKQNLPGWISESFTDSNYRTVITEENINFYRTFGGSARVNGSFVTTSPAGNRINAKINTALVPDWKNSREFEAVIEVPKGQILNIGRVEKQYTKTGTLLKGEGDQILLPQGWPSEWIKEIRKVPSR